MQTSGTSAQVGSNNRSWARPNYHRKISIQIELSFARVWGLISGLKARCTNRVQEALLDPPNYKLPKKNHPNLVDFLGEFWRLISGFKTSQCQQQVRTPSPNTAPRLLDPPKLQHRNQRDVIDFLGEFWKLISGLKTSQGLSGWCLEHRDEHSNESMSSLRLRMSSLERSALQTFAKECMIETGWLCSSRPSEGS